MRRKILRGILASFISILLVLCEAIPVSATAIDVGPGATDRAAAGNWTGVTVIQTTAGNVANDTGTLDVFELWFNTGPALTLYMGTLSGSGVKYTSRDSESLGTVNSGSKQTFTGLHCDVATGDFLGIYYTASKNIEQTQTGGGVHYKSGNQFGTGQQTYTAAANYIISIYATGATAASYSISNAPADTEAFGVVDTSTAYYAHNNTAPANSNLVADGDCTWTITNAGSLCDVDVHGHNWTNWTLGAPGANQASISVYCTGQDPTPGITLTLNDQELWDSLAATGAGSTIMWDFRLDTPTSHTYGTPQQTTITLTARAHT